MTQFNRDVLFAQVAHTIKSVMVEGWGLVYVRELPMSAFAEMQRAISDAEDATASYAICVIYCVCDEAGERVLTMADFEAVQNQSAGIVMKVFGVAAALNPLMGFALDDEKKD